jgi:class 3 adenylate cyclase/predicted ATPase
MDVGRWLRNLGLGQYEAAFRDNEIDGEVLPKLTAEDLKELGVAVVGHRRKILAAIGEFEGDASVTAQNSLLTAPKPPDSAERRHITVMFSDLVGSTALSTKLDPEDLREVISAYHECVAETVGRFDGFVATYMGDGTLIYFGYPQAHEDDAERAVRSGLELITAVTGLVTAAGAPLQTRVGIATGLVVIGDLSRSGDARERSIVGETPNLAARLQGIAEPNMLVLADSTRRLIGNLFDLRDLGPKELKGIAGPVRAWAALRARSVASRFEALHATGLTALIGREEESERLLRRWSRAKTGKGQVALLAGEAGIGKSRLTAELLERLTAEPHTRLRYSCSPRHMDSALFPIISQMERAAGLAHGDTTQAKLDKLDALLAQTSTSMQDAALFADMLSLPNDGRYPALELTPEQRRQRTLEALTSQLAGLTARNPVLMIFEDAHWTDPSSLEVFSRALERIATLRVLMIVTFRPEFALPWIGWPHVTTLTLNRLAKCDINAMIDRVVGNQPLPASIRQEIIERSDGVPLFVEEMTKAMLEAESEAVTKQPAASVPVPRLAVPASLHASLMARLDRLGPAKEVAQIGAVIGREFPHALLSSVIYKTEAELRTALDRLVQAGLLFREGVPPDAIYMFKHALVQDAAHGTLLREPRRALHARIAETLEGKFADIAENQPELLARHCTEAGLIEKAAALWAKAGLRSLERSALVEGAEQLRRALDQIATLPTTPALLREEIKLQVALIGSLVHVKGYAAPETKATVERARLLIEQSEALEEPSPRLFTVLFAFWVANLVAFIGDAVREEAARFLTLAEKQKATAPLWIGHHLMGISLLCTGDISEGRAHLDRGRALYDPAEHRPFGRSSGQHARVATLCYRSWALWSLGYPDAALADTEQAISDARESGHAASLMETSMATFTQIFCGNYAVANAQSDELIELAQEKGASYWKALGTMHQGCLSALTGKTADAVSMITSGIAAWRSTGSIFMLPTFQSYLAWAYADLGQFNEAWRCVGEATAAVKTTKEKWFEAEMHRMAGEIALMSSKRDDASAEAYFHHALAIARAQQAKSWELRAAMSMAQLWRDQRKRAEARRLLAPVYEWFTEGFDTLDLRRAKALLDELAL